MIPGLDVALLVAVAALVASTLAGITGFGGAAVLLPVLTLALGVREAVPVLTVAQLIGNGSRAWFNRREIDLRVVAWFALGAIPCALLGGLLFARAPVATLNRLLGVFLLLVVAWRRLRPGLQVTVPAGAFVLVGSGGSFLSALVGSVGPLMAPFFLAHGLVKGAYIGTEALATVVMHLVKLVAYRSADVLPLESVLVGAAIGPVMVLGSWIAKRVVDRLPATAFVHLIEAVMVVSGVLFLFRGAVTPWGHNVR